VYQHPYTPEQAEVYIFLPENFVNSDPHWVVTVPPVELPIGRDGKTTILTVVTKTSIFRTTWESIGELPSACGGHT